MRLRRKLRLGANEDRLSLTPMIDVTFLLLLFFLCTLQFKTLEGKIPSYLPKDAGAGGAPKAIEDVSIRVRVADSGAERALHYGLIGREYVGLDALRARLLRVPRDPAPAVRIECLEGVRYGEVVALLDMLLLDDWSDVGFVPSGR